MGMPAPLRRLAASRANPNPIAYIPYRLTRLHSSGLFRRTARTTMSRLGVAEAIAELAIGHVRADLIARYNKDEAWSGRSDAFERVSAHIATAIGGAAQFC